MVPSKLQAIFAVGKPVIFVGGVENEIAEWIQAAGAGWAIAENDVNGLLGAIEQAGNPLERKRRGDAARAFAERHFNRSTNCGRIADLLESAAKTNR